jgi:hypothetical protein
VLFEVGVGQLDLGDEPAVEREVAAADLIEFGWRQSKLVQDAPSDVPSPSRDLGLAGHAMRRRWVPTQLGPGLRAHWRLHLVSKGAGTAWLQGLRAATEVWLLLLRRLVEFALAFVAAVIGFEKYGSEGEAIGARPVLRTSGVFDPCGLAGGLELRHGRRVDALPAQELARISRERGLSRLEAFGVIVFTGHLLLLSMGCFGCSPLSRR